MELSETLEAYEHKQKILEDELDQRRASLFKMKRRTTEMFSLPAPGAILQAGKDNRERADLEERLQVLEAQMKEKDQENTQLRQLVSAMEADVDEARQSRTAVSSGSGASGDGGAQQQQHTTAGPDTMQTSNAELILELQSRDEERNALTVIMERKMTGLVNSLYSRVSHSQADQATIKELLSLKSLLDASVSALK